MAVSTMLTRISVLVWPHDKHRFYDEMNPEPPDQLYSGPIVMWRGTTLPVDGSGSMRVASITIIFGALSVRRSSRTWCVTFWAARRKR